MKTKCLLTLVFTLTGMCLLLTTKTVIAQQTGKSTSRGGLTPRMKAEVLKAELAALKKEASDNGVYWSDSPAVPIEMIKTVNNARSHGTYGFSLFTPNGGWLVCNMYSGAAGTGIPPEPLNDLNQLLKTGNGTIRHAAFAPQGGWFYNFGQNEGGFHSNKLPQKLLDRLHELYRTSRPSGFTRVIMTIALTSNNGWVLVYRIPSPPTWGAYKPNKWQAEWENVPDDFVIKLKELQKQQAGLRIVFSPNGGWLILYNNTEFAYNNIPEEAKNKLIEFKTSRKIIMDGAFAPNGGWVIVTRGKFGL